MDAVLVEIDQQLEDRLDFFLPAEFFQHNIYTQYR